MSRYRTVYQDVEVDISLDDFDDSDLIEELESRGYDTTSAKDDSGVTIHERYFLNEKLLSALYRGEDLTELVRQHLKNEGFTA